MGENMMTGLDTLVGVSVHCLGRQNCGWVGGLMFIMYLKKKLNKQKLTLSLSPKLATSQPPSTYSGSSTSEMLDYP